eukprot:GFUD01017447.1.p1 GENE.GFUD01017447.1~~GFUD01017447.1.p1  ORF type:complete len:285 (+),score=70.93 GFUD01017447.1:59-856(+)
MFRFFLFVLFNCYSSVSAFKTTNCRHAQVTNAVTSYSSCTANTINPLVQSLAMKAGDTMEESAIDQNCALLQKTGPIMKCATEHLGKCFSAEELQNLKLAGQNSVVHSMKCYGDNETQMVVEDDIFFSWLELEGLNTDKDKDTCTIEVVDKTNIAFQDCIEKAQDEGEDIIKDTKDIKKATLMATNLIMKCFNETENPCFTHREINFLRTEFQTSIEDTMEVIFGMAGHNMMEEEEEEEEGELKSLGQSNVANVGILFMSIFLLF